MSTFSQTGVLLKVSGYDRLEQVDDRILALKDDDTVWGIEVNDKYGRNVRRRIRAAALPQKS